jgi:hypothetical protein
MSHVLACKRHPVRQLEHLIPLKYIECLEHNQQIKSCCRHPENHDIEAWYSSEAEAEKGVPDIYIFHCTCGGKHRRFCVGGGDVRPFWELR